MRLIDRHNYILFRLERIQSLLAAEFWNDFAILFAIAAVNRGYGSAGDASIRRGDRGKKRLHPIVQTVAVLDVDHAAIFERRAYTN